MSRTGRSSTGLEVLHSSHQCRWELDSRFRVPQLSQTKTSFLTRKKCYVGQTLLPSCFHRAGKGDFARQRKKGLLPGFQFLQCASNRSAFMNMMKRSLVALLTLSALALCAFAANQDAPCPLPITDSSTSAPSDPTQSPEKGQCLRAVHHNGMIICLPCPAWDAHIRHGDTDAGPCDKPGNETPGQ